MTAASTSLKPACNSTISCVVWHRIRQLIKVFETDYEQADHSFEFGQIVSDNKTYAKVAVADGFLYLKNLQLAGKRRMNIGDLLLGHKF